MRVGLVPPKWPDQLDPDGERRGAADRAAHSGASSAPWPWQRRVSSALSHGGAGERERRLDEQNGGRVALG